MPKREKATKEITKAIGVSEKQARAHIGAMHSIAKIIQMPEPYRTPPPALIDALSRAMQNILAISISSSWVRREAF